MALYAASPHRRARQVLADIGVLLGAVGWVWAYFYAQRLVDQMRQPASDLIDSGGQIHDAFAGAAQVTGSLPLGVGQLSNWLKRAVEAGDKLSSSGQRMQNAADQLSSLATIVMPLLLVVGLAMYVDRRVAFARESAAVARYAREAGNLDLLALRALARQPLGRLAAVHPDVAEGWRSGDPGVIGNLAGLELADAGVRSLPGSPSGGHGPGGPMPAGAHRPGHAAAHTGAPGWGEAPGDTTATVRRPTARG